MTIETRTNSFLTNQRICLHFDAKPIRARRFMLLPVSKINLRVLIGLTLKCKQMRWLAKNEIRNYFVNYRTNFFNVLFN